MTRRTPRTPGAVCGDGPGGGRQDGFTLVELAVVLAITMVVLAVFVSMLAPLGNAATEATANADNQQAVRFAADRITSDLRSANPLDPYASSLPSSTYTTQVQMQLGAQGSAQSTVNWVYDPTSHTLERQVLSGPGGTVLSSVTALTSVSQAVFSYYNPTGTDLVAADAGTNVALCAVRVEVVLTAQPNANAPAFTDTVGATLRNQLPGGQSTCTYP